MPERSMSYHGATLQLLKTRPRVTPEHQLHVADVEKRINCPLPPSLREWYAYSTAIEILADHSNSDHPIALQDFAIIEWKGRRLLPLRIENQGVCTWAAFLDGSDDPPVVVDVDSEGDHWQPHAATFSAYVHACVWDFRQVHERPALVQAQNQPLTDVAVDALRRLFPAGPQTEGWPGHTQFRFDAEMSSILIWAAEDQADWFIGADDAVALEATLTKVWSLDGLGDSCYDCSPVGKSVLSKLRGRA